MRPRRKEKQPTISGMTRRDFIRTTGAGSAVLITAPLIASGKWGHTPPSDSIRHAVIGTGGQEEMGLGIRVNTRISVQYGREHMTNAEGMKDGKETWDQALAVKRLILIKLMRTISTSSKNLGSSVSISEIT